MSSAQVTVIIPTLCGIKRGMELIRAISSATAQIKIEVVVFVVVNGNQFNDDILQKVCKLNNVKVFILEEAGISKARFHGRIHVETPYFLFLDDDDELYPSALCDLIDKFNSSDGDTGVVIADAYNDYRRGNYGFSPSCSQIERDPLMTLLDKNWLITQSTLFKTEIVSASIFNIDTESNECTMIAFNLALEDIKIRVLDKIVAVIHVNEDSESKSERFITKEPMVIGWMLTKKVPTEVRKKLQRKLAAAFHNNAIYYLNNDSLWKAVKNHIKSILILQGDSYFLYGRYIFYRFLEKFIYSK